MAAFLVSPRKGCKRRRPRVTKLHSSARRHAPSRTHAAHQASHSSARGHAPSRRSSPLRPQPPERPPQPLHLPLPLLAPRIPQRHIRLDAFSERGRRALLFGPLARRHRLIARMALCRGGLFERAKEPHLFGLTLAPPRARDQHERDEHRGERDDPDEAHPISELDGRAQLTLWLLDRSRGRARASKKITKREEDRLLIAEIVADDLLMPEHPHRVDEGLELREHILVDPERVARGRGRIKALKRAIEIDLDP